MTNDFEFDLIFALPRRDMDQDSILDALFEAGCDDAVVGVGTPGLIGLAFTRSGERADKVISGAVEAVLSALPEGAKLREVKPDLVSQGDIAARLRVSRQSLQKRDLPPPSLGGLYRASEMLDVLSNQSGKVKEALEEARPWFASAPAAQKINARMSLES
jgi:gas vesicle protein